MPAAAKREHLIPVRKTVHRADGGTHEQTFYVKAEDLQPAIKETMDGMKGLKQWASMPEPVREKFVAEVSKLGGDGAEADKAIEAFTLTSSSVQAAPLRLGAAVLAASSPEEARELVARDVRALMMVRFDVNKYAPSDQPRIRERIERAVRIVLGEAEPDPTTGVNIMQEDAVLLREHYKNAQKYVDTVSALAAVSQAMHKEPVVKAFRGIHGAQARLVKDAITAAQAAGEDSIDVDLGALSSWSESEKEAEKFAKWDKGPLGYTFSIDAPRESIVLSHRAMPHLHPTQVKGKKEVTLATKGRVRIPLANFKKIGD